MSASCRASPERSAELSREVIAIRSRMLGPSHPETIGTKLNLSTCLLDAGRVEEAHELIGGAWADSVDVTGADHPRSLTLLHSLAVSTWRLGDPARAAELVEDCIDRRTRTLGPMNVETLRSRYLRAALVEELGDVERAEDELTEVLAAMVRQLGAGHPDTLRATKLLAGIHRRLGSQEEFATLAQRLRFVHRARASAPEADRGSLRLAAQAFLDLDGPGDAERAVEYARRLWERAAGAGYAEAELLARCLAAAGDVEAAVELARRTRDRLAPDDPRRVELDSRLSSWTAD